MAKTKIVGFRADEAELAKLESFSKATGKSVSETLRSLVHQAEVKPAVVLRRDMLLATGGEKIAQTG